MVSLLDRPIYSLAEAARLLRVSPSRLRWWLEGAVRGQKRYPPVLRAQPTGDPRVSWGEFIEAAYLREYRAHLPLQRLRPFRDAVSQGRVIGVLELPRRVRHNGPIRFFFDESALGIGQVMATARSDWCLRRAPAGAG